MEATKYGSSVVPQYRVTEKHFTALEKIAPYTCEFLGTFFLTFTVIVCCMYGGTTWSVTAIAFVLMAAIYATGPISGGHLNPAVSFACFCAGKFGLLEFIQYVIAQLSAAVFAGLLAYLTFYQIRLPALGPIAPFDWYEASIVEGIYTGMLCFVVLNCAASTRTNPETDRNQFYALAIAFVVIAGGYAAGPISGAAFNPAVSVALQFVRKDIMLGLVNLGWYCLIQACGAIVGVFCFVLCRLEDYLYSAESLLQYRPPLMVRILAELIGTFMVVFTFGLNLMQGSAATAWSTAACVVSMMYSLGNVSGGHFNPAVTLGVYCSGRRKIRGIHAFFYIIMQFCGGLLAAACLAMLFQLMQMPSLGLGVSAKFTWAQAFCAECAFTLFLVYVVLTVSTMNTESELTDSRHNFYFGLAVGACYMIGGVAIGSITGGFLNPASSLGLAAEKWMSEEVWTVSNATATTAPPSGIYAAPAQYPPSKLPLFASCANYIGFELLGAFLAAAVFHCTHAKEFRYYEEAPEYTSPVMGTTRYATPFVEWGTPAAPVYSPRAATPIMTSGAAATGYSPRAAYNTAAPPVTYSTAAPAGFV